MAARGGKFPISSCHPDCKDRNPWCHGKCKKYMEAQKEYSERKRDLEMKKKQDDYFFSVTKGRKFRK